MLPFICKVGDVLDIANMNAEFKEKLKYGIDENEDLTGHIQEGIYYFKQLTGTTINFDEDLFARVMLRHYVRYSVNNALEYFENNFSSEILRLQLLEGVKTLES